MNRENYNIQQLFGLAFGQNPFVITRGIAERIASGNLLNRYRVNMDDPEAAELNYQGIEVIEEPEDVEVADRSTFLGTPIVYPMTFSGGTYGRYNPKGELETITLPDFEMPAVTLCDVRRAKNLSVTRRLAGYGTVKEMYGFDDWRIDIRGLCLPDPAHPIAKTAFAQHLQMQRFEEVAGNIEVYSKILNDKGIDAIVIEEIVFGQLPGKPKVIPFQIRAFSDPCDELED